MHIGISLGINARLRGGGFSPSILFANGEQGVWYAPDPDTCFTDTEGTTPAGVGDAVALMLDKSGNRHDATQGTAAARPILARVPEGGRRNLLSSSNIGDFSSYPGVQSVVESYFGWRITSTGAGDHAIVGISTSGLPAQNTRSLKVKGEVPVYFGVRNGTAFTSTRLINFNPINGAFSGLDSGTTSATAEPLLGGGWLVSITHNTGVISSFDDFVVGFPSNSVVNVVDIAEPQLEEGSTATPYQRVGSTYDVTEAGKADKWHLVFDGIDDSMSTPSIDFTGTDEMSVFAGARVIDTTSGLNIMIEHGSTGINAFNLQLPSMTTNQISFNTAGDTSLSNAIESGLPDSFADILTGQSDLGEPLVTLRRGGAQVAQSMGATGGGAFQNLPMFIGGQNGSTRFFNGHIYSLVVRGALTDADAIDKTEAYVAGKTGIEAASEATWDSATDTYTQNLTGLGV